MEVVHTWTTNRAKTEFDQLLEDTKNKGPQEIRDVRGSFTIKFNAPKSSESVTEFLRKGLPDS